MLIICRMAAMCKKGLGMSRKNRKTTKPPAYMEAIQVPSQLVITFTLNVIFNLHFISKAGGHGPVVSMTTL